ncbi:MAG: LCP family protein [Candidatus Gottesmanbacteria bacterium]
MPLTFKDKLKSLITSRKFLVGLLGFVCLICLIGITWLVGQKIRPYFNWSTIFDNRLKQTNNHTNFLLLGVTGGNNAGADLTDTMIFLSVNQKQGQATLVSLPRDIWSNLLMAKINTAYHYGEEENKGGGLVLAKSVAEEIIGLPIHYVVKIDMAGLKTIIDLLGGVEVDIQRTFDDYKFPIAGKENDLCNGDPEYKCRYQHIHFDKGRHLLNGEQALQYIRSRDAQGDEGTDFARSARQQRLILALKDKILSASLLFDPQKLIDLNNILAKILETDIPQSDFPFLGKMLVKIDLGQLKSLDLEKFLINPPPSEYDDQWVLVPQSGDFNQIHNFLKEQILK